MERDEIYLLDVWRILRREWRWVVAAFALVLICAFAFTQLARRQWEATAFIQVGQVGVVPAGQDQKAEPLMRVVERMQLVPFENEVLKNAGFSQDAPESRLYRRSLKLEPMPYAGQLIRLTLRAESPQLARRLADATVAKLGAIHDQLEAGPLEQARGRLAEVENQLRDAKAERDQLLQSTKLQSGTRNGDSASAAVLESVLLQGKLQEIRGLRDARDDLRARLSPTYTYGTALMWPVYVPEKPTFPNYLLIWALGIVAGAGLGAFAAVARNAARRRREQAGWPARASA